MSMKQEIAAWRKAFPGHLYSKTADVVMQKAKPVLYACHADGMVQDTCVLDDGCPDDCLDAEKLHAQGKGKLDCSDWRPITIVKPNAGVRGEP